MRPAFSSAAVVAILVLSLAGPVFPAAGAQTAALASVPEGWLAPLQWRNIGPARGGRSIGVAGSPGRRNEYWFGAVGGGLWKTTDAGQNWAPVTDGQLNSSSVGAVAVAETNPDVIWIGMGETELRGNIMQGDGVYRSIDGGRSWRHMGLADTQAISRVRIHPTNPEIVYVAALGHPYGDNEERGVFRTTDGGVTWEKVLYVSDKAGAVDLIIDPANPRVLYASTWQVYRRPWQMWGGGPDSGLFKSENGGDTWSELTANPGMPEAPIGKIGITVSPADPDRLYAIVEANEGGVFRSDDGGASWERTNDERKIRQRHFYYSRIYADPFDPDTVYALNTGLYKSTDGGHTFDIRLTGTHGDFHDLWIDPNDPTRMITGNDGGGAVSINGGETWTDQDFPTAQLYHITTTSDFPYHVCGAQQDNSTICVPSDGWDHLFARGMGGSYGYAVGGGESGYITQSPTDPDTFYAGSQGALLTRYDRRTGQIRDVQVYPYFFSGEPSSALRERWQWTFPIVFSPVDSNALYTTSQHVWKTTDEGQSWTRISPDLTLADEETLGESGGLITMDMNGPEIYATVFALAPSYQDADTIWAGSDDGLVHITRDGGESWQNITPPDMLEHTRVSIIDASRHDAGTAYVAGKRYQMDDRAPYLWRTHDYGATWTKIVDGIRADDFLHVIREDPFRRGMLYAGGEHGVWVSWDDGDHWQSLQLNLPDTQISDLIVEDHDLVIGTHGRSVWVLDDIDYLRDLTPELMQQPVVLFEPAEAVRGVTQGTVQYWLQERAERVTIEILDADGNVVDAFSGSGSAGPGGGGGGFFGGPSSSTPTTAAGMNAFTWNLRYPGATVFDGMIIWSGRPERGPKAPPGAYTVRLTVEGGEVAEPREATLSVVMDPRLEGVTDEDLVEQFRLASSIRDATSQANEAVITIRSVRRQALERLDLAIDAGLRDRLQGFVAQITEIEEALYQVRNQSGQDPLNFPIRLNNRLASLRRSVETGDARPTEASYVVFRELKGTLDVLLSSLANAFDGDLTAINDGLRAAGEAPIAVDPM